jgi:hypothetical protein
LRNRHHSVGKANKEERAVKDDRGLYYYPFPQNKRVRMYVREVEGNILFRLWNTDDPELWEEHGWVPYDAIKQAAALHKKKSFDPNQAYDINVAKMILKEA